MSWKNILWKKYYAIQTANLKNQAFVFLVSDVFDSCLLILDLLGLSKSNGNLKSIHASITEGKENRNFTSPSLIDFQK